MNQQKIPTANEAALIEGKGKAAKAAGVSAERFGHALTVREHAPHLIQDVIDGKPKATLDTAYEQALNIKREKEWRDNGVELLRREDPDLAQRVQDQELSQPAGFAIFLQRHTDRTKRQGVIEVAGDDALTGASASAYIIRNIRSLPLARAQNILRTASVDTMSIHP